MRVAAAAWAGAVAAIAAATMVAAGGPAPDPPTPTAAPAATPMTRTVRLESATGPRTATVYRPAGTPRNAPLVVVLHGAGGSATAARRAFGWDALADREKFVVAYPNGYASTWNAGRCCGRAHERKVDDVGFLHRLARRLAAEDAVDPRQVFAVGMSNGAMMAYAWACARPDELAGVGAVAGVLVANCRRPAPVTVAVVHGTADRSVPINGGVGPRSVTRHRYPALTASLAPFLAGNGCDGKSASTRRQGIRRTSWSCAGGRTVTRAVVEGLGHEWPGPRQPEPVRRTPGSRTAPSPLDATTFLWANLRSAPRT